VANAGAVFVTLLMVCSSATMAGDRHEELALQFDQLTKMDDPARRIDAYITAIETATPDAKFDREPLKKMIMEIFDSAEYREAKTRMYKELFTEAELEQLVILVQQPAFKLLTSKRTEMTQKTAAALQPIMSKRLGELIENPPGK
jgi:hypothetical protein